MCMKPGDIMVFYASLIHINIFSNNNNNNNRRLIQVFEVYKNNDDFVKYNTMILHIPSIKSKHIDMIRNITIKVSKITFLINIISTIALVNVATGYGYKFNKNITTNKFTIFSSEGLQDRLEDVSMIGPINKYIMMHPTFDTSTSKSEYYRFILQNRQISVYMIIILVIICLFILGIYNFIKVD